MSIIYDALKKIGSKTQAAQVKPESRQPSSKPKFIRLVPVICILISVGVLGLIVFKFSTSKSSSLAVQSPNTSPITDKSSSTIVQRLSPVKETSSHEIKPLSVSEDKSSVATKRLPHLSITGIFLGEDKYSALINNQVVEVGDSIKGAQIDKIDFNGVEITFEGSSLRLSYP